MGETWSQEELKQDAEAGKDPDAVFSSPREFSPMLRGALQRSIASQLEPAEATGDAASAALSPHGLGR